MLTALGLLFAVTSSLVPRPAPTPEAARWATRGLPGGDITCLAAAPDKTARVYAGTTRGSIYRSDDSGRTWTFLERLSPPSNVVDIQVDPNAPETVYALTADDLTRLQDGIPTIGALFRSDDEGLTWKRVADASTIAVDPRRAGAIYRGVSVGPVYRSSDGGRSWSEASPAFSSTKSVLVDASQPDVVYAFFASVLYRTADNGVHWAQVGSTLPLSFHLQLAGHEGPNSLLAISEGNVYRSADGGQTWTTLRIASATTIFRLAGDQASGGALYAATDHGVFRSDDLGASWAGGDSFSGYPVYAVASRDPDVYAGTFQGGGGFFRSEDRGAHWALSDKGLLDASVVALGTSRQHPSRLYAGGQGIFRSDDYGSTFETLSLDLRPTLLAVDPSSSERLYASSGGSLWSSLDAGTTWSRVADPPLPATVLLVDAAGTLYAGGSGEVFKSTNMGGDWLAADHGLPAQAVLSAVDPVIPGVLYAIAPINFYFSSAIYKTLDGGQSWTGPLLSTSIFQIVTAMTVSPLGPRTIYAVAVVGRPPEGALYASVDGGSTWSEVASFLEPNSPIACDPFRPGIVYAGLPPQELVYEISGLNRAVPIGQRGVVARTLTVAPDGRVLYEIDTGGELGILPLGFASASTKTLPFR